MRKGIMISSIFAGIIAVSGGCAGAPRNQTAADQCLRVELFQQCMQVIPAGPKVTHDNDWHEVIEACESAAYYQSLRTISGIAPECRA